MTPATRCHDHDGQLLAADGGGVTDAYTCDWADRVTAAQSREGINVRSRLEYQCDTQGRFGGCWCHQRRDENLDLRL
jgi:hypothetical protein